MIEPFLREVDGAWPAQAPTPITLSIIGSTALMLQTSYRRGTKDSDVLEVELDVEATTTLLQLAGRDTALARKHRLYVDLVKPGVPFLPHEPHWIPLEALNATLEHLDVRVLDIVDVVVSKLKRFSADDRSDIDRMVALGHVDHGALLRRFESAWDLFLHDARAPDLVRYARHLNMVERDMLGCPETAFELPDWADR